MSKITPIPKWRAGDRLNAKELNKRLPKPYVGGVGIRVVETPNANLISLGRVAAESMTWFWARISGSTPTFVAGIGPVQWRYTWAEQHKVTAGYGGWMNRPGGRTSETFGLAYNAGEDGADGVGVDPHGYDVDSLPTGFAPMQSPAGRLVRMCVVTNADGTKEAWFDKDSAIDGACGP